MYLDFPNGAFPIDFWHGTSAGRRPIALTLRRISSESERDPQRSRAHLVPDAASPSCSPHRRLRFNQVGAHWYGRLFRAPVAAFYALTSVPGFTWLAGTPLNPYLPCLCAVRPRLNLPGSSGCDETLRRFGGSGESWQSPAVAGISRRRILSSSAAAAVLAGARRTPLLAARPDFTRPHREQFRHVVVATLENRSFDHFLGWLPFADGCQAGLVYTDRQGGRHATRRLAPDFQGCGHPDPDHSWAGGRVAFAGGACDGWLRAGANDEFAIGYYAGGDLPFLGRAALDWTVCDRYFAAMMGPTFPNRLYLNAGTTDRIENLGTLCTLPTIWDRLAWPRTLLVITFDEWGGFFDHVPPTVAPDVDPAYALRGFRVPCLLVSPWSRRGGAVSTTFDHASILRMIEQRWKLRPLSVRDETANSLADALDFTEPDLDAPGYEVPDLVPALCAGT